MSWECLPRLRWAAVAWVAVYVPAYALAYGFANFLLRYLRTHSTGIFIAKTMGQLKIFIKGALGTHISKYKRSGFLGELSSSDMGFYGGLGAGIMINLSDKVFINAEYEWAYVSNYYYDGGFVNSAMGGIGMRF